MGKHDTCSTRNFSCSIPFSSTFHVISWKFGLLFGQCGGVAAVAELFALGDIFVQISAQN